jgi:predicted PurR-regulated permease PerM
VRRRAAPAHTGAIGAKGHGMDSTLVVRALGLSILALLAFVCLRTLEPFVGACLWGVTLAVAAWPARVRLTRALGGRRKLAAGAIVAALVLVLVAPLAVLAVSLADQVDRVSGLLRDLAGFRLPPPPAFLATLPAVGGAAVAEWRWAGDHAGDLVARAEPYAAATGTWLLLRGARLGVELAEMVLAVILAGILLANGEACVAFLGGLGARLGGERATELLGVSTRTLRGVVNGVVGTAVLQALVAAVAFAVAGVPGTALLAVAIFILALAQLPSLPLILVAAAWLGYRGATGWAVLVAAWGLVVSNLVDAVVRPYLMGKGAEMPLIGIFLGVVGGLLAFGLIGVFVGPIALALAYHLLVAWAREGAPAAGRNVPPPLPTGPGDQGRRSTSTDASPMNLTR